MNYVSDSLAEKVSTQVLAQARKQVAEHVLVEDQGWFEDQIWDLVRNQVMNQVWNQVADHIWCEVEDRVWKRRESSEQRQ